MTSSVNEEIFYNVGEMLWIYGILSGLFGLFSVFPKPNPLFGFLQLFLWGLLLARAPGPEASFRVGLMLGLLSYFWVFLGFIGWFALIPLFVWLLASLSFGVVSYLTVASFPLVSPYLTPFLFPLLLTSLNIILSFGPWGIWNQQSIALSTWGFASPLAGVFGVHVYGFTIALMAGLLAMGISESIPLKLSLIHI